jgi:hypothetical protein
MKKYVLAAALAIAVAAVAEQKASAWFNMSFNHSCSFNMSWGGHCGPFGLKTEPWPGGFAGGPAAPAPAWGGGYPAYDYGHWDGNYAGVPVGAAPLPGPVPAPVGKLPPPKPVSAPAVTPAMYQTVGYYYGAQNYSYYPAYNYGYGYGYGSYGQAPSYWYGN